MIKGGKFYAFYDEDTNMWTTNPVKVAMAINKALDAAAKDNPYAQIEYISSFSTRKWKEFLDFTTKMPDRYEYLDRRIVFANTELSREDYASKRVPYALGPGTIDNYEELVGTLYSPEERQKFEWAIGAIGSGDSSHLQKFIVFRGSPGSGKSTVINIMEMLFKGYYNTFDAKALGDANKDFAMEPFVDNPIVAIQHDGDLSGIEDNTRLNSIVSHEYQPLNAKYQKIVSAKIDSFLIMGTNKPVRITDSKSGIIRRLIDIYPSDQRLPFTDYMRCMKGIEFELGAIMNHCIEVYAELGPSFYDNYIPTRMMSATNDIYNFLEDNIDHYMSKPFVTLDEAWKMYNVWADETNCKYRYSRRVFKEELKEYFTDYSDRKMVDGVQVRGYYGGFKSAKFLGLMDDAQELKEVVINNNLPEWLNLSPHSTSSLDIVGMDWPAQYAVSYNGTSIPSRPWKDCDRKLQELNPTKEHYLKVPENLIVIDFDIPNADGEKDLEANLTAASEWPRTYCETSKSGKGIHLHYIYKGDVTKLARIWKEHIEIKVYTGGAALRRRLSLANDEHIAEFTGTLPMKEVKPTLDWDGIKNEKHLRAMIAKNLNKEYHGYTKPSMDYIVTLTEDAYNRGIHYDISDLKGAIRTFAINASNSSLYCLKRMNDIKWKSEEPNPFIEFEKDDVVFFDVEVFPNLFVLCYKKKGRPTKALFNPEGAVIEKLCKFKLIGFNNREYDNHILYARMMGYDNENLYKLSKKIIKGEADNNGKFMEAYNLSYTDIYDFCSEKMSLKKWEIRLGILHMELGLDWDQPVPPELWEKVAKYCVNDVDATEAVFEANAGDFAARQILAEIANIMTGKNNSCENTKTNTLTARIIFGNDKNPQKEFIYTDLSKEFPGYTYNQYTKESMYKGIDTKNGGYADGVPGMYYNVWTFDVAGMHPASAIWLNIFGDKYTAQYKRIRDLRLCIKHKEWDKAKEIFDHKLDSYIDKAAGDKKFAKALSQALKIAINAVYGMTSAPFDNPFKDPRNVDNIVAKRGALFMINLREEIEKRGGQVIHIKTDSVKVVNPTKELADFIFEYGRKYGYEFEVEHVFDRICLVNDAVYIGKLSNEDPDPDVRGSWTATGTQFKRPYVFKTLFSKEDLEPKDFFETRESKAGTIYIDYATIDEAVKKWEDLKEYRRKANNNMKITKKAEAMIEEYSYLSDEDLAQKIADGHDYQFVGRVGCFIPVNKGGGTLVAKNSKTDKFGAVTDTKGHKWAEAGEIVGREDFMEIIDLSYFDALATEAVNTINQYGSYEFFTTKDGVPF